MEYRNNDNNGMQNSVTQRSLPSGRASVPPSSSEPPATASTSASFDDEPIPHRAANRRRQLKHDRIRAAHACRRCRRQRCKCVMESGNPPCEGCLKANTVCDFSGKGEPDIDRSHRHPRSRKTADAQAAARRAAARKRRLELASAAAQSGELVLGPTTDNGWDGLPPLEELIDGVNRFTHRYFQLGFIHKTAFPEQLRRDHRSVSLFLLLSILCTSARFTPALVARYGSKELATDFFMDQASTMAVWEVWKGSTLERCQAYYLLGVAQQGTGAAEASYVTYAKQMNIGIATKIAVILRLHREETYAAAIAAAEVITPELVIRAESARRTMWQLHSQDSLHSGPLTPSSIATDDLHLLLPCSEYDFANGRLPSSRAALAGTPPAKRYPELVHHADKSLFGSLLQVHAYWGYLRRNAPQLTRSKSLKDQRSESWLMMQELRDWERTLPPDHKFSIETYRRQKQNCSDLAYLSVTNITRLCNIIVRRPYLSSIIHILDRPSSEHTLLHAISRELFGNVSDLFDQIDAQFTNRTADEGVGAQMTSFCVYSCGLFLIYICQFPHICQDPALAKRAPQMFLRVGSILQECKEMYPMAARWPESLENLLQFGALHEEEGTMADGKDPIPHALHSPRKPPSPPQCHVPPTLQLLLEQPPSHNQGQGQADRRPYHASVASGSVAASHPEVHPSSGQPSGPVRQGTTAGVVGPYPSYSSQPMPAPHPHHPATQAPTQSGSQAYQTSLPHHPPPPTTLPNPNSLVSMHPTHHGSPMYMHQEGSHPPQALPRTDSRMNVLINPAEASAPQPYLPQMTSAAPASYYRHVIQPENDGFDENMQAVFGYSDCIPHAAAFFNGPGGGPGPELGPDPGSNPAHNNQQPGSGPGMPQ